MTPTFLLLALVTRPHLPVVQHLWAPLLVTSAERIDIDTSSVQVLSPSVRRVWLRWNLQVAAQVTSGPNYQIEHRDLDCASHRTRIVEKRMEGGPAGSGNSMSAQEASWQAPTNGSLLAQVLAATCRLTKAGA
jgi:hypothetical protein